LAVTELPLGLVSTANEGLPSPSRSFKKGWTSANVGMEGCAPGRVTEIAAPSDPKTAAHATVAPRINPNCKSTIECVSRGGGVHNIHGKSRGTLLSRSSLGDQATAQSQLQQEVLDAASQKSLCRCIVALADILGFGLKQFLDFSFLKPFKPNETTA